MQMPKAKPQLSRERALEIIAGKGLSIEKEKVILLGLRGYFRDSMGAPLKNDIGIYDDAFCWIDENEMQNFNGNTDPSRYRPRMASLLPGAWSYKKGLHGSMAYGPYPAYRQAAPVIVERYIDGKRWAKDKGLFGINIHHGSKSPGNSTSSLGCQTVPWSQWKTFKAFGDMLLDQNAKTTFTYLLVDQTK